MGYSNKTQPSRIQQNFDFEKIVLYGKTSQLIIPYPSTAFIFLSLHRIFNKEQSDIKIPVRNMKQNFFVRPPTTRESFRKLSIQVKVDRSKSWLLRFRQLALNLVRIQSAKLKSFSARSKGVIVILPTSKGLPTLQLGTSTCMASKAFYSSYESPFTLVPHSVDRDPIVLYGCRF